MIKRFVGCGDGRMRISKGGVWGDYCVNEGKEEEKGGEGKSEADWGSFTEKFRGERNCE